MKEQSITTACVFLKLIWEETKDEFKEMNLNKLSLHFNVPYGRMFCAKMVKHGILEKVRLPVYGLHFAYHWVTKTEPNIHMAKAILQDCLNESTCRNKKCQKESKSTVTEMVISPCNNSNRPEDNIGKRGFGLITISDFIYGHIYEIRINRDGIMYNIYDGNSQYTCSEFFHTDQELRERITFLALQKVNDNMKRCGDLVSAYERTTEDI